jgi:hypothetical protein
MTRPLTALGLLALAAACATSPQGGTIPDQRATKPEPPPVEDRGMVLAMGVDTAELQAAYEAAGRPTVGFIRDRYQLPIANPLGAARIIEGNLFGMPIQQSLTVPSTFRPFAIEPLDPAEGFEIQQLALLQEDMARAGVRFVEVTAADAMRIVNAEKAAAEGRSAMQWNEMVASGANILVSFQEAVALGGPIFMVRVIRMDDGALLALRTGPAQGGAIALRPLLARAIADGMVAAANNPLL